ncbi:MAG: LytTR family DNA-binding domain-containing protein [Saprospiraceae bacterium]
MKVKVTIAIVDDEPDARSVLRSLLGVYCPDVEIIGEAEDVPTAVSLIRLAEPDIVLLDIHLKESLSFEIINKFINPSFKVVFITAHDNYAIKAFRYFALDYILKPVDPDLLIQAIDKAKNDIEKNLVYEDQLRAYAQSHEKKSFEKIALPSLEGVSLIKVNDILYLQADGNYCCLFTNKEEKVLVTKTLKDFEGLLPEDSFFRTHQSFMVNIQSVKKILKEDGGFALLENGKKIPISRRKKEAFLKKLMKRPS